MIKFIIQHYNEYNECVNHNNPTLYPLEGAVYEKWVETQSKYVSAQMHVYQEARLNDEGKPYIHYEKTFLPYDISLDWKNYGFDHTSEKIEVEGKDPHWIYTRKVNESAWTITVETLEQIEEFLDREYEMGVIYTPVNGIRYYLIIY